LTASKAPGLPTSVALPTQSLTIQAVLISAWPSVAICSFHKLELEQLGSEDRASSSQLQLSGTHCRLTFAPRPSVAVSFEQGFEDSSFQAAISLTFPVRTIKQSELKRNVVNIGLLNVTLITVLLKVPFNKKAQLSLTNPRDAKACQNCSNF